MRYFLIFLLSLPITANAEWDTTDKVLGAAATTALVVDWGQTRYIAKNPQSFEDRNKLLGKHPSTGQVDLYFASSILGTLLIADWLSPTNRKWFLGTITAVELVVTSRNQQIGIKLSF